MTTQDRVVPLAIAALVALLVVAASPAAAADTPIDTVFTYQGHLEYNGGPIDNEECTIDFTLWDAETGGTQAGETVQATVYPENGYFTTTVDLGMGAGFAGPSTFSGSKRWLQLDVDCESDLVEGTILPRQPITATPYAMSLMPEADIIGAAPTRTVLRVGNTTTGEFGSAVTAETSASKGTALIASSTADDDNLAWGVYATTAARGGTAVYGESLNQSTDSGDENHAYGGHFVAKGRNDIGVYGQSTANPGGGAGGAFESAGLVGTGVLGIATNESGENTGVLGLSSSGEGYGGVFANHNNIGIKTSGIVDLALGGDGVIEARDEASSDVTLISHDDVSIRLDDDNNDEYSSFMVIHGSNRLLPIFEVRQNGNVEISGNVELLGPVTDFIGNVRIDGNFEVVNGSKSAVVSTEKYGDLKVYAVESPGNWFEDFGAGELKDGAATVEIEPVFAQTVNTDLTYHVFLTPLGDCALYVAEKTPASFSVRARAGEACNAGFDYRIVAKRRGFEQARLDPVSR